MDPETESYFCIYRKGCPELSYENAVYEFAEHLAGMFAGQKNLVTVMENKNNHAVLIGLCNNMYDVLLAKQYVE